MSKGTPLAVINVAPGEALVNGHRFPMSEAVYTVEQAQADGRLVILATPRGGRWDRARRKLARWIEP